MMAAFMLLTALSATGLVAGWRLATGQAWLPARPVSVARGRARTVQITPTVIALAVGLGVLLVTRWPVAGALAAVVVVMWPQMSGGAARERASVTRIEAIAAWTESLRDTNQAASGLEYAIPSTLASAPPSLQTPLRHLNFRLSARVPLPEALALFAEDVDDAGADLVVAALALNARQRAGSLSRVLTTLAANTRTELELRRRVMKERDGVRRQAQQVAFLGLALAAGQAVLVPAWVAPYGTPVGQVVLAALAAAYVGLLFRLRKLAEPEAQPRFLVGPDEVIEAASYKPRTVVASS